jgi:hypothetical protein
LKRLLPIFFLLLSICSTFAQQNLQKGYILLTSTDTVFGQIDEKNYYHNSLFCDFKAPGADSLKRYYPADLFGYRFTEGKYYISKNVSLDGKDTLVFLEYLMHGKLDLYFIQDKGRINHCYAADSTSSLIELMSGKDILYKDGKLYEKDNKQYISALEYLTRDDPGLKKDLDKLEEPTQKKLVRIGTEYHEQVCKDWDCIVYSKKIKYRYFLEFSCGYKNIGHYFSEYYRSSSFPLAGVKFYINNPRFSERSYFGLGFFYEGKSVIDSSGVSYQNWKIPLTYSYSSPKPGLSPSFSAGINLRTYDNYLWTSTSFIPGLKIKSHDFFVLVFADIEFASVILIPVKYHSINFGISFNYQIR